MDGVIGIRIGGMLLTRPNDASRIPHEFGVGLPQPFCVFEKSAVRSSGPERAVAAGLKRRQFFAGIAGGALATLGWSGGQAANPRGLRGRVAELVLPGDPRMDALAQPQNLAYAGVRPLAIARCAGPEHVANAIGWARDNGVPFVLRSGGHSYAGCSVTSGLLIDMRPMSRIAAEPDGTVRVGGGALNGQIYAALRSRGLAITHGRCSGVGASAFLMGGGIGFAMRDHGMGCDLVRAASFILADGREALASPQNDAELFWAIRGGGGGNLGAATEWTLATVRAEPVTVIDLTWKIADPALFITLVRALESSPGRMGTKLSLVPAHGGQGIEINLLGQLRGPEQEARDLLAPAVARAQPTGRMAFLPYWEAQDLLSEEGKPAFYRETSCYLGRFPEAMVEDVFRRLRAWPETGGEGSFKLFHVGGRIRDVKPEETAYVHRDAEWISGTEVTWAAQDSPARIETALTWQRAFHDATDQLAGPPGGSYQNFLDPGLADPATAYYGANLPRLMAIRAQLDPDGIFHPPRRQGIPGPSRTVFH